METNLNLLEQIKDLIKDQGDDIDIIEQNISKAY